MAFTELIKNYRRIRAYLREFYVYGFRSRDGFEKQSGRSYDDERRRVESYLRDYCGFRYTESGKVVFLSIDSRSVSHNPLYRPWKSKSFTDLDITLHFLFMDMLQDAGEGMTLQEMLAQMDERYLKPFSNSMVFDESSLRKKLKEYAQLGVVEHKKQGRQVRYYPVPQIDLSEWWDAIAYFSEVAPCGVLGSFLLDWQEEKKDMFFFKHHYITHAGESEVLCQLFDCMGRGEAVGLDMVSRKTGAPFLCPVVPLRMMYSAQSGRCHLLGYDLGRQQMRMLRVDHIEALHECKDWETEKLSYKMLQERVEQMQPHLWGVSLGTPRALDEITMTIVAESWEAHIPRRLRREKRCGMVEQLDERTWRFRAQVYDAGEMIPWLRTWICRIQELRCSNPQILERFWSDYEEMKCFYQEETEALKGYLEEATSSPMGDCPKKGIGRYEKEMSGHPQKGDWKEPDLEVLQKVSSQEIKTPSLFHEIWGCYYRVVGKLLGLCVSGSLTTETLREVIEQEAFEESAPAILEALVEGRWQVMYPLGEKAHRADTRWETALKHPPVMPLTTLQKRWLKAISMDARTKLFLGEEAEQAIAKLQQALGDVMPLFEPGDYVIYDAYGDGDPYEEATYQQVFRQLRQAVKQAQTVYLQYRAVRGTVKSVTGVPTRLEYSEKDDKFRVTVRTSRGSSTLNVAGIQSCRVLEALERYPFRETAPQTQTLVMTLRDERNALDRALLHFAHFEKQAEQLSKETYRISLVYDKEDETELLIRVLSFGPMLQVEAPNGFIESMRDRFERQEALYRGEIVL